MLFEPGVLQWDDDLVDNSSGALETLVCIHLFLSPFKHHLLTLQIRVGMSLGHSPDHPAYTPDMQKENPTNEEKQDAKRRIEGSLAPGSSAMPPSSFGV